MDQNLTPEEKYVNTIFQRCYVSRRHKTYIERT